MVDMSLTHNASRHKLEPRIDPLRFVDMTDIGKHIVLFYGEREYGRMIEFRFINNGLLKGQHCFYLTHGNASFIEKEMSDSGIDVEIFKRNGLLHVFHIDVPTREPEEALASAQKIWDRIIANSEPPFRGVGRIIPKLDTDELLSLELRLEHFWQEALKKTRCSWVCPYPTAEMPLSLQGRWIADILEYHNSAIFATKFGEGTAMKMR